MDPLALLSIIAQDLWTFSNSPCLENRKFFSKSATSRSLPRALVRSNISNASSTFSISILIINVRRYICVRRSFILIGSLPQNLSICSYASLKTGRTRRTCSFICFVFLGVICLTSGNRPSHSSSQIISKISSIVF